MIEHASPFLAPWASFYTMTGSSASALIGLMFVVITLTRNSPGRTRDGISTFSTPTVVHFGGALLVSATLSAPWPSLLYPCILLAITASSGIILVLRVARRIHQHDTYQADAEDWTWHTFLPTFAYVAILAGALMLPAIAVPGLFPIAGAVVLMLFIGIHNAWDIVTFMAVKDPE